MLDRLVASHPERSQGGTGVSAILALLLHGGVLSAAVLATWPAPGAAPHLVVLPDTPSYYIPGPPAPRARPAAATIPGRWQAPHPGTFAVPTPEVGPLPPVVEAGDPWIPSQPGGTGPGTYGPAVPGGSPSGTPGGTVWSALAVDEPPVLLTHPALEYPALLRTAGLEGLVVFEVVIDSTGTPEPETLRVVSASHPGFVAAATRVVLGARFRPGHARGRPVRVLIRQPIAFRFGH